MATKDLTKTKFELLELVKALDTAVHLSMPPAGNAHAERAQVLCNELRERIKEEL